MTMTPRSVDHLEEGRGGQDLGRDLGFGADGDRMGVPDELEELLRGRAVGLNDLDPGLFL
jgi:hypothetical protein